MKEITESKIISKSLEEVWTLKELAYENTKDKSFEELKLIYQNSLNIAAKSIKAKLLKLPDGNYKFE